MTHPDPSPVEAELPDGADHFEAAIAALPTLPGLDSPLSALVGGPGLIHSRMIALKRAVKPIAKSTPFVVNRQERYRFRGIDEIYNALHDLLGELGVYTVPVESTTQRCVVETGADRARSSHVSVLVTYRFYAEDGSYVVAQLPGEGIDRGDKATGKALSMAHKYAFVQALALPTGEPDNDHFDVAGTPVQDRPADAPAERSRTAPADAPADAPARPFDTAAQAETAIAVMDAPDQKAPLSRRIFASVRHQKITGGEATFLMQQLTTRTRELGT